MMTSKIQYVNNTPYWALASKARLAWMVLCCVLVSMVPDAVFAQDTPIVSHREIFHPVFAEHGIR